MDQQTSRHPILREDEAAHHLGLSPSTLRSWRSQKRGPRWCRLGRRVGYPLEGLESFLRRNTVEPGEP